MQLHAPFKERLIRYRMETEERVPEPVRDPELTDSIRLGALAGFGLVACAVVAFMLVASFL